MIIGAPRLQQEKEDEGGQLSRGGTAPEPISGFGAPTPGMTAAILRNNLFNLFTSWPHKKQFFLKPARAEGAEAC